jgi:hypothetical protein
VKGRTVLETSVGYAQGIIPSRMFLLVFLRNFLTDYSEPLDDDFDTSINRFTYVLLLFQNDHSVIK